MNGKVATSTAQRHYLTIQRPRCPVCGSPGLKTQRSIDNGDGTRTRYTKCTTCRANVILTVE